MLEHITRAMYGLDIHLLYASAVCLAAWVMTSSRSISANTKYWILVAASLNFFLPLGAILDGFGASHFGWASPLGFVGDAPPRSREACSSGYSGGRHRAHARPGALLGVLFGTLLFSGVFATISHTACCFVTHR